MNLTCILTLIKFDLTLLQDHITVVWNSKSNYIVHLGLLCALIVVWVSRHGD